MKFKEIFAKTLAQAIPILITALLSVLISFLQSFLASYAGAHTLTTDPEQVAILGAGLKSFHSATLIYRHTV